MQSQAKDVTTYIEEASGDGHEALTKLRELCLDLLPGFEERMEYGGPSYWRNGEVEVGFASQKNFIGLFLLRTGVMAAHRDQLKMRGVSVGKGRSVNPNRRRSISMLWKACCAPRTSLPIPSADIQFTLNEQESA